ncbi:MAG: hypothetical protein R3324_08260 [Halobacteriales archaeon]|nr:hypothetical protein [Halobacteriales archaeon]
MRKSDRGLVPTVRRIPRDMRTRVPAEGNAGSPGRAPVWAYLASSILVIGRIALVPLPAASQDVMIPDAPTCPDCSIELQPLVTLGDSGEGYVSGTTNVVKTDDGFLVVLIEEPYRIAEFDASGAFVRRVGGRGEGPDEFKNIRTLVVGPNDSVFVFDGGNGRISVLTPELETVRTARIPGYSWHNHPLVLPGGRFLVNTFVPHRERLGYAFHVLTREGDVIASFHDDTRSEARSHVTGVVSERWMAEASDGGFWAASLNDYRIERFDGEHRLVARFSRDAPWFTVVAPPGGPSSALLDIREIASGELVVIGRTADPEWRDAVEPFRGSAYTVKSYSRYYDSVLEVIDPRTGRLVHSQRFDEFILTFVDPDHVVVKEESPTGDVRLHVMRLRVVRP